MSDQIFYNNQLDSIKVSKVSRFIPESHTHPLMG